MRPYACDTGLTPRYPSISLSDTNPSDVWQKRARHIRPTLLDDISVKEFASARNHCSVFRRQDVTWRSLEYKKYSREHDTASTERTGVLRTLQSATASPHTSMTSEVQACCDCKLHDADAVQLEVNCQNRVKKKNVCERTANQTEITRRYDKVS